MPLVEEVAPVGELVRKSGSPLTAAEHALVAVRWDGDNTLGSGVEKGETEVLTSLLLVDVGSLVAGSDVVELSRGADVWDEDDPGGAVFSPEEGTDEATLGVEED